MVRSDSPAAPMFSRTPNERISTIDPLIARAQAGDADAFRELFRLHRDRVTRIVYRFMGPSPEVEDVVQDVFLHVHRSLPRFRGDARFTTWLYRLTANVTKMHIRRKTSRPRIVDTPVPEKRREDIMPETPDEAFERRKRIEALYRLIERLPEKKRTVLVMHDLDGVSPKEIAEIVEAPIMTVRTRLFYARKELFAALASEPALATVMRELVDVLPGKPKQPKQGTSRAGVKRGTKSK